MKWLSLGESCIYCHNPLVSQGYGLCHTCFRLLSIDSPYCARCGLPLHHHQQYCGTCLQQPPKWSRLVCVNNYEPPLPNLIHQFKFNHHFEFDRILAILLFDAIKRARRDHFFELPEAIIAVPLSKQRQWWRGYNQSQLLCSYLSDWLALPNPVSVLVRKYHISPQRGLNASQRQQNIRHAFRLKRPLPYKRIALVDDVVTTGSTVSEICSLLKKSGIEEIQVWALARISL